MTRRDARFFGIGAAAATAVALAFSYCGEPAPEQSSGPSSELARGADSEVLGEEPALPDADLVTNRTRVQTLGGEEALRDVGQADSGEGALATDASTRPPIAQDQDRVLAETDERLLGTHSTAVRGVAVDPGAPLVSETTGAIVGRVRLRDPPEVPAPEIVSQGRTETDRFCRAHWKPQSPVQVNSSGHLANALVRLSWGMEPLPGPDRTLEVAVRDCSFSPTLGVVVPGQTIRFTNRDPVPHDLSSWALSGFEYSPKDLRSLKAGASTDIRAKESRNARLSVLFGGSIDLVVVPHPYWSVTSSSGEFALPQLPPGTYTLTAWHPRLGKKDQLVIVQANHQTRMDFDFSASDLRR